jgi:hypothetical protein
MSFFIMYFETPNSLSTNYKGFADIGMFSIPDQLYAGKVSIIYHNKKLNAHLIADESRQSANNFFLMGGDHLKKQLIDFIESRIHNDCIIAHVSSYIENNDNTSTEISESMFMTLPQFNKQFDLSLFKVGHDIAIKTDGDTRENGSS